MFVNFPLVSFLFPLCSETIKEPIKETTSRLLFPSQPLPFTIDLKPLLLSVWDLQKSCKISERKVSLIKISCHFLWNWVPINVVWWFENNETNFSLRSKSHLIYLAYYKVDIFPIGNLIFFLLKIFGNPERSDQIRWRKIS